MKKLFFMLVLFVPFIVLGEECPVIVSEDIKLDRTLTCDEKNYTTTSYKTTKEETILSNDVCTIKCTENLVLSFDPIKKILAGTSFNYPLYVSGERKCVASYNFSAYETKIKSLINSTSITKDADLVNYYDQKKKCDQFTIKDSDYYNKYKPNGNVELLLETSSKIEKIKYVYEEIGDYYSKYKENLIDYTSCNYDEVTKKCNGDTKTIESWIEVARTYGKYTMPNTYMTDYTGEISYTSSVNSCDAGDRYFVSLYELTKPVVGAKDDNGYKLTLQSKKLNSVSKENWNLTVNCFYKVNNLIFPTSGTTTLEEDENYSKYGSQAFMYRIIDNNNPFPDRSPLANWVGKTSIFESPKIEDFILNFSSGSIRKTIEYNKNYPYDTFNLDEMEKSLFIKNNTSFIDRK